MPNYDAGVARGRYELDISQAEREYQRLRRLLAPLDAQKPLVARAQVDGGAAQAAALSRAATAAQRLETERQKTAQATINVARAEQNLAKETANAAAAQDRAAAAAIRRAQAQDRAARAAQQRTEPPQPGLSAQGLNQAAGAFGLAVIGPQLVGASIGATIEAGKASLALQRTEALTRTLAGTQQVYNQVVAAARQQQELYGGTLQENIQNLAGLTVSSRSSGAELSTLIDLSQRLAILDPAQGLVGAQIALREALSGDTRSLALRFEIPRKELALLKDESLPVGERLLAIDQYLNKINITSKTASDSISEQARAYNRFNATLGDLQTTLGGMAVNFFTPAVEGANLLLNALQGDADAVAELGAKLKALPTFSPLQGQFGFTPASVSSDDVSKQRRENERKAQAEQISAGARIAQQQATGGDFLGNEQAFTATNQKIEVLRQKAIDLALTSEESSARVRSALASFAQTGDLDRLASSLQFVKQAQEQTTQATEAATPAYINFRQGQSEADAGAAEQQRALADIGRQVADGMLTQEDAVARLIVRYPELADEADALISEQARLERQALAVARALNAQRVEAQRANEVTLAKPTADSPGKRGNDVDDVLKFLDAQKRAQEERNQTTREQGTATQKVALAQKEYNDAVKANGADSAEAIAALRELNRVREATKPPTRAARSTSGREREELKALESDEARLAALRAQYEAERNKNSTKAIALLNDIRDLEEKITKAKQDQAQAALDAQLSSVRDAQKRLEEEREIAGLKRALAAGNLTDEQKRAAELRLQEIDLERQQRANQIAEQSGKAGIALPVIPQAPTLPAQVPNVPPTNAGQQAPNQTPPPSGNAIINLIVDGQNITQVIIPNIVAALRDSARTGTLAGSR